MRIHSTLYYLGHHILVTLYLEVRYYTGPVDFMLKLRQ